MPLKVNGSNINDRKRDYSFSIASINKEKIRDALIKFNVKGITVFVDVIYFQTET